MLKFCYTSVLMTFAVLVFSQSPRIGSFYLEKTLKNKVIVNWSMKAGSTCLDLQVERLINGEFKTVYTYPSVCGDSDKEEFYSWIDENVPNYSIAEYRIKLEQTEFTLPITIDLDSDLKNNEIVIFPNPASKEQIINVKFRNQFKILNYSIINQFGQIVYTAKTNRSSSFKLPLTLDFGVYFLRIDDRSFKKPIAFIIN